MNKKGFTIVELLIVIVVIGLLASVSVVAYRGVAERAKYSAVKSDLSNTAKQLGLYKAENGQYPSIAMQDASFTISKEMYQTGRNNFYYCVNEDRSEYAIGAIVKGSSSGYSVRSGFVMTNGSIVENDTINNTIACQDVGGSNVVSTYGYDDNDTKSWRSWMK